MFTLRSTLLSSAIVEPTRRDRRSLLPVLTYKRCLLIIAPDLPRRHTTHEKVRTTVPQHVPTVDNPLLCATVAAIPYLTGLLLVLQNPCVFCSVRFVFCFGDFYFFSSQLVHEVGGSTLSLGHDVVTGIVPSPLRYCTLYMCLHFFRALTMPMVILFVMALQYVAHFPETCSSPGQKYPTTKRSLICTEHFVTARALSHFQRRTKGYHNNTTNIIGRPMGWVAVVGPLLSL